MTLVLLESAQSDVNISTRYRLISSVVHEGKVLEGAYKTTVYVSQIDKWMEIQDLYTRETLASLVQASPAYMLFFERIDSN